MRMSMWAMVLGLSLACGVPAVQADEPGQGKPGQGKPSQAGPRRPGGPGQGGFGQGPGGDRGAQMREAIMKKFDTNGDGQLSETEKEAARAAFAQQGGPGGQGGFGKGPQGQGGPGGPGGAQMREQLMKRFDKNGDGQLSDDEKQAARAEFAKNGGPGGQGAPGQKAQGGPGKGPGEGQGQGGPGGERGAQMREQMLKKFDTDGDGQLNDAEKQAARAAFGQRKKPEQN